MSYETLRAKIEQLIEKAQIGGGGEGIQYTDIVYNDDNTVTLTDTSGVEHTISCVYENNRLLSMTYDGKEVVTVYDNGELVGVGETEVDVANAPLDNTLENLIDQSGVLDSTEGTITDKVEQLVDKAEDENIWYQVTTDTQKIGTFFSSSKIERLPRINFSALTSLSYAFSQTSKLKRIDDYMDTQNCTNFNGCFQYCKQLEYVKGINLASATFVNACFANCISLKTIEEPIDFSYLSVNSTEYNIHMFSNTWALETIRIVTESIKKSFACAHTSVLTPESIQSIIDGLATVETTQTLTLHADVKAKLTQTQLDTITSKNWNLA
jgi:hypothetical protein